MSVSFVSRVEHVEFRVSGDSDGLWFGLFAPEGDRPNTRLFAGPVTETMPDQLRALADRIDDQLKNGAHSAGKGHS